MDDLIYIIALIAWVAFAFYRKSQKKSAADRNAGKPSQQGRMIGPLPTLEEILLGREPKMEQETEPEYEPEPVYKTEPLPVPVYADGMSPPIRETSFEREYNLRGITSIEEMDKSFLMTMEKTEKESKEMSVLGDNEGEEKWKKVDLRQAVIYAEILNRPYV